MISVIVPIYNGEEYLKKCLDSITKQTYSDLEIILINDGSTDNTQKICDSYADKDIRIKVIHKENEGVSTARNVGISKATGKYITFVDADDYIESTMYEKMVDSIEKNNSDMVICNYSGNEKFNLSEEILTKDKVFDYILGKSKFRGYVWNRLYKKEFFKDINFKKDISLCEDLLINCEYLCKCNKISIVDEKLYNYMKREQSAVNKFLEKHFSVIKAYQQMEKIYEENSHANLVNLHVAYLKQCAFLKYYNFCGNYGKKYIKEINSEAKRLKKKINNSKISLKTKIITNIYYTFPIIIGKLREIKYK